MFETVQSAPPDAILGLTEAFRNDPRPEKINLTVGVYKDATGTTPILDCVKEAEKRLLEKESSKSYLGIDGIKSYGPAVRELVWGKDHEIVTSGRAVTVQSLGGTGALRVAADFIHRLFPSSRIWCSTPTWPNHPAVFKAAGLTVETYPYFDADKNQLDFEAMLGTFKEIPAGDVLCLHGSCHNPTGIDPSVEQWRAIADVVAERGLLPLVDFAYQGFGDGLTEDAAGLRELSRPGCEMLVASSFSKNLGLYCERVGAMTAVSANADAAETVMSQLKICIRTNYSNPAYHGGGIVTTVLEDAELRKQWEGELAEMRDRINGMRALFAETMSRKTQVRDFSFIQAQRGIFSRTGLSSEQVDTLRDEHAIYLVRDGRMNVAGMTENNVDRLCEAIASIL